MPDMGCFYLAEPDHPVRHKRDVERVTAVELCQWREGYALVHYSELTFSDMSNPIKIYFRKSRTAYVNFNGKRYNIDVNNPKIQFIHK